MECIKITDEMRAQAIIEYNKREPYINHKFLTSDTNYIGFVGEFACNMYLELDWKRNIRSNYNTPDSGDIIVKNGIAIDIKTQTVDEQYLDSVLNRNNRGYHLLVNEQQIDFIKNTCKFIIWGCIPRDKNKQPLDKWYPLGYISVDVLDKYKIVKRAEYKSPCLTIPLSELQDINLIKHSILKHGVCYRGNYL